MIAKRADLCINIICETEINHLRNKVQDLGFLIIRRLALHWLYRSLVDIAMRRAASGPNVQRIRQEQITIRKRDIGSIINELRKKLCRLVSAIQRYQKRLKDKAVVNSMVFFWAVLFWGFNVANSYYCCRKSYPG